MGWTQKIEYEDVRPAKIITVKKQLWNANLQQFEPAVFMRVACDTLTEFNSTVKWLHENYGHEDNTRDWWTVPGTKHVWMRDSVATFWKLKN